MQGFAFFTSSMLVCLPKYFLMSKSTKFVLQSLALGSRELYFFQHFKSLKRHQWLSAKKAKQFKEFWLFPRGKQPPVTQHIGMHVNMIASCYGKIRQNIKWNLKNYHVSIHNFFQQNGLHVTIYNFFLITRFSKI